MCRSPLFPPVMRPINDDLCTGYCQFHILLFCYLSIRQLQMIFTSQNALDLSLSKYVFHKCWINVITCCELRTKNLLQAPNLITNTIGASSLISRGAHLWNTLPDDIKNVNSSAVFYNNLIRIL